MSVVTATISSAGQEMDPTYELMSIDITKEVNRIPSAQLVLLDGSAANQTFAISNESFFEPGKEISIKLRYEDAANKEATVFIGLVIGQGIEAGGQGSYLTVELKDAAVKLTGNRKSIVYRQQTDSAIISNIIAQNGLAKGSIASTDTVYTDLVQYYATDWDFMLSRADAEGLLVGVDDGTISLSKIDLTGSPQQTFEFGISEIYNIEIEANGQHQPSDVTSVGWDMKTQARTQAAPADAFSLKQGNLDGKQIADELGFQPRQLTSAVPLDPTELQAWSNATMTRARMSLIRGRIAVPGLADIKLLDVIKIDGIGDRFNGNTIVTGIRHSVTLNGWQTDIQFGLSAKRFAEHRDIVDVSAAGLLPGVNGLQVGVVAPFEADPGMELHVKVTLPSIDETEGYVWARLAMPDAGADRGIFFWPEPGDEVVVGFFNDDPRQAVILGSLFSSKNSMPSSLAPPNEANTDKAIVTKSGTTLGFVDGEKAKVFIETPEKNTIVLDDETQTIELSDQHGNVITMGKDGITITSAKDLTLAASGNVSIQGTKVDVK